MPRTPRKPLSTACPHHGFTLVELLVVMSIGVLLMSAAVPLLRAPLKQRKAREATRQIAALITRAQGRAAELGRPVGVRIQRASAATSQAPPGGYGVLSFYSYQLSIIETSPPYIGDLSTARATVTITVPPNSNNLWFASAVLSDAAVGGRMIKQGDLIKFDYKEPTYMITQTTTTGTDPIVELTSVPWVQPFTAPPKPGVYKYQIFPNPGASIDFSTSTAMRLGGSAADMVELPNGIAIDLTCSGMGTQWNQFTAADINDLNTSAVLPNDYFVPADPALDFTDVIIMFEPGGGVESVYFGQYTTPSEIAMTRHVATGTVYLLIGKIEQVNPANVFLQSDDLTANLMDEESLWVAISHKTGKVTSAENFSLDGLVASGQVVAFQQAPGLLGTAREFARSAVSMGGR